MGTLTNSGKLIEKIESIGDGGTLKRYLTEQPQNPEAGDVYYDTIDNVLKIYDGTQWNELSGGGGGGGGGEEGIFGDGSDGTCVIEEDTFMQSGIYNFQDFTICEGATLRFQGEDPLIINVKGKFKNDGVMSLYNPFLAESCSYLNPYFYVQFCNQCNPHLSCANTVKTCMDTFCTNLISELTCENLRANSGNNPSFCEALSWSGGSRCQRNGSGGEGGGAGQSGGDGTQLCNCSGTTSTIGNAGIGGSSAYPDAGGGGGGGGGAYDGGNGQDAPSQYVGGKGGNGGQGVASGSCSRYDPRSMGGNGGNGGFGLCKGGDGGDITASSYSCYMNVTSSGVGGKGGNSILGPGGNGGNSTYNCQSGGNGGDGGNSLCGNGGNGGCTGSGHSGGKGGCSIYGNGGNGGNVAYCNGQGGGGQGGDSIYGNGGNSGSGCFSSNGRGGWSYYKNAGNGKQGGWSYWGNAGSGEFGGGNTLYGNGGTGGNCGQGGAGRNGGAGGASKGNPGCVFGGMYALHLNIYSSEGTGCIDGVGGSSAYAYCSQTNGRNGADVALIIGKGLFQQQICIQGGTGVSNGQNGKLCYLHL